MRKKVLTLVLSAFLAFGQTAPYLGARTVAAADITNHWAGPYMQKLMHYGIMRGDQSGNLNPDAPITRAEFVSMTNRAFGYDRYQGVKMPFKDVDENDWYADDIAIAYSQGYFSGDSKSTASPDSYLTREQAVSLICRNLKVEDYYGEALGYTDSRTFSEWSKSSINAASEKGYVNGYTDGTFRPFNSITRGEAAKIFADVVGELVAGTGTYSFGEVNGNVTVSSSGATLKDTFVNGDIYITAGVGSGYVNFENVQVTGEIIISGGGESNAGQNSINFEDCSINKLIIDGEEGKVVSVDTLGNTTIRKAVVKTDAYFENFSGSDGFLDIEVNGEPQTELSLSGDFEKVTVLGRENYVSLGKGSIQTLTVDEDAVDSIVTLDKDTYVNDLNLDAPCEVRGEGEVSRLTVSSNGTVTEMLPDEIIIRPGLTAEVNGEKMDSIKAEQASSFPKILAGYPKDDEIAPTSVNMLVKTNKPGTLYYAVVYEEDSGLSAKEIKKPDNVSQIIKSGTIVIKNADEEVNVKVSGLKADTRYTIEAVLVDERDDTSGKKSEDFRTADNTIPNFASGYPKVTAATGNTLRVELVPTKDVTVYWGAFPAGSQAPTDREIINQKLDGEVDKGKEKRCKKNEISYFTVSGLKEKTSYDIYMVLSDGENNSAVKKVTASTSDTTPPVILDGFPRQDKTTDKAIDVRVKVNEDSTVYWVLVKKGADFPPPVPPSTTPPALDSEDAKDAVVTGNNTLKNGRVSVKQDAEGTIKLNGLEAEGSYDLYVAAQDSSKNTSVVKKLSVKTTDMVAPTAKQEFSLDINGEPKVEGDITIRFSEEVWNRNTMKPLDNATLSENIKLYNVTDIEEELVDIRYDMAEIGIDDEGRTYVTFPSASLNLNSGDKYQFELSFIVDTSNNRMKDETRLDVFKTVSPLVQLSKTEAPEDMDITFSIDPQSINTADTVLFDMIFETDTTVEFILYEKGVDENGNPVVDSEGNPMFYPKSYKPLILAGDAMTLHYIIDRKSLNLPDYTFEKFNELEQREYGIRFTSINGDEDRGSWSSTVKMKIKCVTGSKTVLSALAGNPKGGFDTALENGASQVNYPLDFEVSASFTDTAIPEFMPGYPELENGVDDEGNVIVSQIGDTLIRPDIMTNKKCVFWYFIAPEGTVKDTPSAIQIMSGAIAPPAGGVTGSYPIPSGRIEVPVLIEGLLPETDYEMYYFLKGNPPEPSPVQVMKFKTLKVAPPTLSLQVIDRAESSATIRVDSDKNATIDWIVLPQLSVQKWFIKDEKGNTIIDPSMKETIKGIIRNGQENLDYKPITPNGFGTVITKYDKTNNKYSSTIEFNDIERNIYYVFFAVARTNIDSGETNVGDDSEIAFEMDITPADVTAPSVEVVTTISNAKPVAHKGQPYKGTILLTFSEEVYYIPGENQQMQELTAQFFSDNLVTTTDDDNIDVNGAAKARLKLVEYTTKRAADGGRAIKTIKISFSGIINRDTIFFPYELCDVNGNKSGMLKLTFHDMEGADGVGRGESYWSSEFTNEAP